MDWGATFPLQDVEQAYASHIVRAKGVHFATHSILASDPEDTLLPGSMGTVGFEKMRTATSQTTSTGPISPKVNDADAMSKVAANEEKCEEGDLGTCVSQPRIESDAYRIQRRITPDGDKVTNAGQATQTNAASTHRVASESSESIIHHNAGPPRSVDVEQKVGQPHQEEPSLPGSGRIDPLNALNGTAILDQMHVIFPSAYNAFLAKGAAQVPLMQNPIITLDPHFFQDHTAEKGLIMLDALIKEFGEAGKDEMFLSDERFEIFSLSNETEVTSKWIQLLKPPVDKSSNTVPEIESRKWNRISLALLLATRMEACVMAAYDAVHEKTRSKVIDGSSSIPSQSVPSKKQGSPVIGEAQPKPAINPDSDVSAHHVSSLAMTNIAEAVKLRASDEAALQDIMDPLRHLVSDENIRLLMGDRMLPLVVLPLSWTLQSREGSHHQKSSVATLASWNDALAMSMKVLCDDSAGKCHSNEKEVVQQPDDVVIPDGHLLQSCTKKSKKKKKRKKHKLSNPDQSPHGPEMPSDARTAGELSRERGRIAEYR